MRKQGHFQQTNWKNIHVYVCIYIYYIRICIYIYVYIYIPIYIKTHGATSSWMTPDSTMGSMSYGTIIVMSCYLCHSLVIHLAGGKWSKPSRAALWEGAAKSCKAKHNRRIRIEKDWDNIKYIAAMGFSRYLKISQDCILEPFGFSPETWTPCLHVHATQGKWPSFSSHVRFWG